MFKNTLGILLVALALLAGTGDVKAQQSAVELDRQIKARVNDLGAGAKVTIFLKDGTKIQGNISQILADSFDVTLKKETQSRIISYRDVQRIKKRGLSSGAKVAIGVAIGAGAIVTVLMVLLSSSDGVTFSGPILGP